MRTSSVLRTLIRACVDDERTLRNARRFVAADDAEALERLAAEREQFVVDLELLAGPSQRRPTGSWTQLLREAGHDAWVTAAGPNRGDAIATCRDSRARTEARFDVAMQESVPGIVRAAIETQRGLVHDEADQLNRLSLGVQAHPKEAAT